MMIIKLKELMTLNAEMNVAEIESRFTQIAKLLFENFAIQKGEKSIFSKKLSFISITNIIVTSSLILVSLILCIGI